MCAVLQLRKRSASPKCTTGLPAKQNRKEIPLKQSSAISERIKYNYTPKPPSKLNAENNLDNQLPAAINMAHFSRSVPGINDGDRDD